ncbi:hypothetical protein OPQ81_007609 [Rhizoctonia solani]|nr:hypothetical protein OPQ81_007609 [Rhizoctonia solani]
MQNDDKTSPSLLEFQDPPTRTSRVEELLASTPSRPEQTISLPPRSLDELRSTPLSINHDLLNRLEAFLPAMHESTQQLQQQAQSDPSSLDIEHLDPSAQEYIEMNLGLGVYESRPNWSHTTSTSDDDSTQVQMTAQTFSRSSCALFLLCHGPNLHPVVQTSSCSTLPPPNHERIMPVENIVLPFSVASDVVARSGTPFRNVEPLRCINFSQEQVS